MLRPNFPAQHGVRLGQARRGIIPADIARIGMRYHAHQPALRALAADDLRQTIKKLGHALLHKLLPVIILKLHFLGRKMIHIAAGFHKAGFKPQAGKLLPRGRGQLRAQAAHGFHISGIMHRGRALHGGVIMIQNQAAVARHTLSPFPLSGAAGRHSVMRVPTPSRVITSK